MIKWPDSLVDDVARRRSVLFLGAGISRQARNAQDQRPKTWAEFLKSALERCPGPKKHIRSLINERDYLTACEVLKAKMDEEYARLVQEEYAAPRFQAAQIHEDIFRLDSRIVATPNFDKIYDTLANQRSDSTVKIKHYYDEDVAATVRGDARVVIKVHGTVDSVANLIFTREEYTRARYKHAHFYGMLDALALTHTFVFLGAGLNDPDIRLVLENHAYRHPYARPHYMVAPKGSIHQDVQNSIRKNLNLKLLLYDPDNFHQELADSVSQLVQHVEAKRAQLAQTQDW